MVRVTNLLLIVIANFLPVMSPAYAGNADLLGKEILINNEWGPNFGELGLYFKFAKDNTFKTETNFEGGAGYSGTYKIAGQKLVLKIITAGEGKEFIGKELIYRLFSDDAAIFFTKFLELENGEKYWDVDIRKLWNQRELVNNDQRLVFQNIKAVTINDFATIKESTSYYQFPKEDSKRFMFSVYDDKTMKSSDLSYVIPAQRLHEPYLDGLIQLILRTTEKDDKNRYWYCIVLPVSNGSYDHLRLEGSDKGWDGKSIGWIKETDIVKIKSRH